MSHLMNKPVLIVKESFQQAWVAAAKVLCESGGELNNLVVTIERPEVLDANLHSQYVNFAHNNVLINPKAVAYTIFPHKLYRHYGSATQLFAAYTRKGGLYQRLKRRVPHSWGTYFQRMICYPATYGNENQLHNIINAIRNRNYIHKAAYTIVIQCPGNETIKPRGGPCLNYIAVQLNSTEKKLGLMAVYRNHDFLVRTYGNYWGLCNLLMFMANETCFNFGYLTCISSRAYVDTKKKIFENFVQSLI